MMRGPKKIQLNMIKNLCYSIYMQFVSIYIEIISSIIKYIGYNVYNNVEEHKNLNIYTYVNCAY